MTEMETAIIETPITDDPYSMYAGICGHCGKWIHWAETYIEDELGLEQFHLDCDNTYLNY
jgi:hypothetical protein